ncbi:MAG: hypothetical protein ABIP54_04825 [Candidatus Andersenbacteria bacterium]
MWSFLNKGKEDSQDIWQSFHGKGDSDDILEEKAKMLGAVIFDWARRSTLDLIEEFNKDTNEKFDNKFAEIFIESIVLYLHYIDRVVFQLLGTEQRNFFMHHLLNEVTAIFSEAQSTQEQKQHSDSLIVSLYNERQKEYGSYKMKAGENEGLGGTLFWEFGKKITDITGLEKGIITMTQVQVCIVTAIQFFQLDSLFRK